jgi:DNA-binding transcriptional LysR family regulator
MTLDLAYLLDFKALAETGSFSRAAFARNVTQPAFSRRIRALEDWAGAALFQRGSTPVTLTDAGRAIGPAFEQALLRLTQGQADAQAAAARGSSSLHFAATHVLSFTFFPAWLRNLEGGEPLEAVQLSSDSLSACEQLIQEGRVQFLLCHHHEAAPVRLDPARFLSVRVGADVLSLVTAATETGTRRFQIPNEDAKTVPYLGYSEHSGLGRIVAAALPGSYGGLAQRAVFQSHLAAALRSMALAGRGVAWLPRSLIADDLLRGALIPAAQQTFDIHVGIHLFRASHNLGKTAERFWARLARTEASQRNG